MSRWQKFRGLTWAERLLWMEAALTLLLVALCLRLAGFKRCRAIVSRLALLGRRRGASPARTSSALARMVRAAAVHGPYNANCLEQSLTLWWLLRRRGMESFLRIGTRRIEGQFEAHAWVEFAGCALNEGPDVHANFAAFERPVQPFN